MKSNGMIFKQPQFEIKYLSDKDWKRVSEKDFLIKLAESFDPVTPVLKEMFQGNCVTIRDCIYRIQSN